MEPGGLCNARAMSLMDSPAFSTAPTTPFCLPRTTLLDDPASPLPHLRSVQHRKPYPVLHRPVESTPLGNPLSGDSATLCLRMCHSEHKRHEATRRLTSHGSATENRGAT